MIQVSITRQGKLTNRGQFSSLEEAQAWLAKHEEMGSFGKKAYSYEQEISPAVLDENGNVISPAVTETVNVPAEYEVSIEDVSAQLEQERINRESLEYLAATDWMVIRMQETGTPVPQEVLDQRAAARLAIIRS